MLHLTLVKKIVSPCFKERQFLTSTSAGGVALLNEVFPTRFTPQNLMEKLGHLFAFYISAAASKFLFNFVSQKTRCSISARFLLWGQSSPPFGLHAQTSSTKVLVSFYGKQNYSPFVRSRKLPLLKAVLRLFTWLCYNFNQLAWKPTVVNLNTTYNFIDFPKRLFCKGLVCVTQLRYVVFRWNPRHTLVPYTKAVFCFPKKAVFYYAM